MSDSWISVCDESVLIPDTGICAKVGNEHVAIFKVAGSGELFAISNVCPFGKASVLSRGLIGETNGALYVASPLLKQRFRLNDGVCLDDDEVTIATYPVRVTEGQVEVAA
ncbi:nitrite reductase small subunit NirD [Neiella marina]|uniref:Nitrite reductase small subunit NirD n=1 Tax=Neiella holothuriorum TaxID=2870530 RepID=A0ABS7EFL0_9GAMM|nr:nitrite reductase small subunit NirD [Neiella holothuriorum]MBW8191134.1 nitrite reductase small subunit NirD [Neiella holothuriorum]